MRTLTFFLFGIIRLSAQEVQTPAEESSAIEVKTQAGADPAAVPKDYRPRLDVPLNATAQEAVRVSEAWRGESNAPAAGADGRVLYSFGAGLPTVVCAPLRVCMIELQAGEKIIGEPQIGDSVRWNISPALYGTGDQATAVIILKPHGPGLDTNLLITTDRRAYYLRLISKPDEYVARVAFAYAVQLAAHAGATVIATASGEDGAYLKSIGASRVIDYREKQFEKVLKEKVDMVFHLTAGDTQQRSFLVLKEGGHLVSATQPVSPEEAAKHRVSGVMMRLAPSGEVLGKIGRLLEEGVLRPDVATVYALKDVAQAWKDIARNLPTVHGMSPREPGSSKRNAHGKIVLRVALREDDIRTRAYELYLARGAEPGRDLEDWLRAEREVAEE